MTVAPVATLRAMAAGWRASAEDCMQSRDRLQDDAFERSARATYKATADTCRSHAEALEERLAELDALHAEHERRVTELLAANNILLARARAAEARIGICDNGEPMSAERALEINGAICNHYFAAELGAPDDSPPDVLRGVTLGQMLIAREITKAINEHAPSIGGQRTIRTVVALDCFIAAVCVLESYPAAQRAICTALGADGTAKAVAVVPVGASAKTQRRKS